MQLNLGYDQIETKTVRRKAHSSIEFTYGATHATAIVYEQALQIATHTNGGGSWSNIRV